MKKIVYLFIAVLVASTTFAQSKAPLEFKEVKHNFGKIKQGTPVTYAFAFKNVSDKPVVIESAVAGCGCTTPEYPKSAIAKGATEKIKVTYNAAASGAFTKDVKVTVANVKDPIVLNIEGEVITTPAATSSSKAKSK